jgi:DNA-binding transcriptional regulator LsrR (DeoR family)
MAERAYGGRSLSVAEREHLADVAEMYFVGGLDQFAISKRIGVSRSSVSRLLTRAIDTGAVEFRINRPLPRHAALQEHLRRAFPRVESIILDASGIGPVDVPGRVGLLAAERLMEWTSSAHVLGISWGSALRCVADAISPVPRPTLQVVQLIGGVGSLHPEIDGEEVGRTVAQKYGARYRYLNAPLLVGSEEAAASLRADPSIGSVLELGARSDLALVGLGVLHPEDSSLLRAGYQSAADLRASREVGAVGDICGHHLDASGSTVDLPLHRRLVSISTADLGRIPVVVAVATGERKAAIMLAALRSGLVDILVTDSVGAAAVAFSM